MKYLFIIIFSYLLGSIPTAYLLVKWKHGKDIREEGSGNVGTLNSFEVTKSKLVAIITLIIDLLKGTLPVFVAHKLNETSFSISVTALIFAVAGHCFNPWLKFKGGRGLATAAGGSIMLSPLILLVWLLLWLIAYVFKKNIHFANIAAIILSLALALDSAEVFNKFTFPRATSLTDFRIGISILFLILLIRHWQPLKEMFNLKKK